MLDATFMLVSLFFLCFAVLLHIFFNLFCIDILNIYAELHTERLAVIANNRQQIQIYCPIWQSV